MKILGIGTDIISTKRLYKTIKVYKKNFKRKIYTNKEISYCEKKKNHIQCYAKRFAAKEAFTKALGTGFGNGISLRDIEINNNKKGKPSIKLYGTVLKTLKKKSKYKKCKIYLSLSDDTDWACANVIIMSQ